MRITKKFIFYFICCIIYIAAYFWTVILYGFDLKSFLYLSMINLFSNLIYSSIMMILATVDYQDKIYKKLENYLFKFNFCFSFTTLCIYWTIVSIDVNLVLKKYIPVLLNLFLHGGIYILLLIDHYVISQKRYTNRIGIVFFLYFYTIYSLVTFTIYYFCNITLYPLVGEMNIIEFIFFALGTFCVSTISIFIYKLLIDIKNEKVFEEEDLSYYESIE